MRNLLFILLLTAVLLQSCDFVQKDKASYFCRCSYYEIFQNVDTTRLMGLSSVGIVKKKYTNDVGYVVRVFVDNVDSTFSFYDLDERDIQGLKFFLDSCSNNKLEYGEAFSYEKNGIEIFNKDCFLFTYLCPTNFHYVDMRVSPQEFKKIIEKAEKYINDDKRKSAGVK